MLLRLTIAEAGKNEGEVDDDNDILLLLFNVGDLFAEVADDVVVKILLLLLLLLLLLI